MTNNLHHPCKICSLQYHYCFNCGVEDYHYEYCSDKCFLVYKNKKLDELAEKYNISKEIVLSIMRDSTDIEYLEYF